MNLIKLIPESVKAKLRPRYYKIIRHLPIEAKYDFELDYWKNQWEKSSFDNSYFKKIMLSMAEENDESFIQGKIIADFGCGPLGSLQWASSALLRIGIDVLADGYADHFRNNIISYGMIYVKSTEKVIPIPSDFIDVLFTLNAMDHVDNFEIMCKEIIRIMKPGGEFVGSFNLELSPTVCEPQRLTEKIIKEKLLNFLEVKSYRVGSRGPNGNLYASFFDGKLNYKKGQKGFLWVRAKKPIHH